ncbi:MAG: Transcriptional regulator, WhiB family, partial [uncultured Nocardioidaceae bacterium]
GIRDELERRLGVAGTVQAGRSGRAVRPWRGAEPGEADVRRLPRAHRVPRRGSGQRDGVGCLGRHDRAGAPGDPPQASERHLVAAALRGRAGRARGRARRRQPRL